MKSFCACNRRLVSAEFADPEEDDDDDESESESGSDRETASRGVEALAERAEAGILAVNDVAA